MSELRFNFLMYERSKSYDPINEKQKLKKNAGQNRAGNRSLGRLSGGYVDCSRGHIEFLKLNAAEKSKHTNTTELDRISRVTDLERPDFIVQLETRM